MNTNTVIAVSDKEFINGILNTLDRLRKEQTADQFMQRDFWNDPAPFTIGASGAGVVAIATCVALKKDFASSVKWTVGAIAIGAGVGYLSMGFSRNNREKMIRQRSERLRNNQQILIDKALQDGEKRKVGAGAILAERLKLSNVLPADYDEYQAWFDEAVIKAIAKQK